MLALMPVSVSSVIDGSTAIVVDPPNDAKVGIALQLNIEISAASPGLTITVPRPVALGLSGRLPGVVATGWQVSPDDPAVLTALEPDATLLIRGLFSAVDFLVSSDASNNAQFAVEGVGSTSVDVNDVPPAGSRHRRSGGQRTQEVAVVADRRCWASSAS